MMRTRKYRKKYMNIMNEDNAYCRTTLVVHEITETSVGCRDLLVFGLVVVVVGGLIACFVDWLLVR